MFHLCIIWLILQEEPPGEPPGAARFSTQHTGRACPLVQAQQEQPRRIGRTVQNSHPEPSFTTSSTSLWWGLGVQSITLFQVGPLSPLNPLPQLCRDWMGSSCITQGNSDFTVLGELMAQPRYPATTIGQSWISSLYPTYNFNSVRSCHKPLKSVIDPWEFQVFCSGCTECHTSASGIYCRCGYLVNISEVSLSCGPIASITSLREMKWAHTTSGRNVQIYYPASSWPVPRES